ncbi:hypothetical protein AVEN_268375-1 [Araneus ventricosus]|uniref:Uncharacterized protein n=1 Tax=Araneus ventricosus TaxID=182803 RepID=A0A4Y2LP92_ARAVE|nr:hypothetical protein AVEN_268375-1 [Araneus ventricosus]
MAIHSKENNVVSSLYTRYSTPSLKNRYFIFIHPFQEKQRRFQSQTTGDSIAPRRTHFILCSSIPMENNMLSLTHGDYRLPEESYFIFYGPSYSKWKPSSSSNTNTGDSNALLENLMAHKIEI